MSKRSAAAFDHHDANATGPQRKIRCQINSLAHSWQPPHLGFLSPPEARSFRNSQHPLSPIYITAPLVVHPSYALLLLSHALP